MFQEVINTHSYTLYIFTLFQVPIQYTHVYMHVEGHTTFSSTTTHDLIHT